MLFDSLDLKQELEKERKKSPLLSEVYQLLDKSELEDKCILERLKKHRDSTNEINIASVDNAQIFSLQQIKNICIKYRLRFLDLKFFKNEIPYDALIKIKQFEREHNTKLEKFKIIAPSSAFSLIDRNKDPLLMADLGNGNYYLVHQWGNNLSWYRKLFAWSLKNFTNLAVTIFALSLLTSFFAPVDFFFPEGTRKGYIINARMFLFLLSSLGLSFFSIYISLTRNKNFSETEWNSRFLS